nr:hypothetical protein [Candidatus Levybacteria bacterium]
MSGLKLRIISLLVSYISYSCLTVFFSSLIFLLFWYLNTGILIQHLIELNNLDFNGLVRDLLFWSTIVMLFSEIIKKKIKIKIDSKILILLSVVLFIVYSILFTIPFLRTDDLDIQATIFGFWAISLMFLSIYIGINWALKLISNNLKNKR